MDVCNVTFPQWAQMPDVFVMRARVWHRRHHRFVNFNEVTHLGTRQFEIDRHRYVYTSRRFILVSMPVTVRFPQ